MHIPWRFGQARATRLTQQLDLRAQSSCILTWLKTSQEFCCAVVGPRACSFQPTWDAAVHQGYSDKSSTASSSIHNPATVSTTKPKQAAGTEDLRGPQVGPQTCDILKLRMGLARKCPWPRHARQRRGFRSVLCKLSTLDIGSEEEVSRPYHLAMAQPRRSSDLCPRRMGIARGSR